MVWFLALEAERSTNTAKHFFPLTLATLNSAGKNEGSALELVF